jgi:hypothetical protein
MGVGTLFLSSGEGQHNIDSLIPVSNDTMFSRRSLVNESEFRKNILPFLKRGWHTFSKFRRGSA